MHVLLAGGGSAGHVEPALALGDALRRLDPSVTVTALGTARGLETRLVPARGYPLELIPPAPLPRRLSPDLLRVPGRLRAAVSASRSILTRLDVDVVAGFGGYVALPAYLAARGRVPIVVHEANARPGLANWVGARLTRYVAVSTPDSPLPHGRYLGIPLRPQIAGLDRPALRASARATLGLDADRPTLLVFGGSQGAQRLNRAMTGGAARRMAALGVQVLHAAGERNLAEVRDALAPRGPGDPPYVLVPYLDRMDLAYAAADLVLCRSGAMTCAELAAVGLPAVYVPYAVGNGEQRLNARPLVDAGGGLYVADADLTAQRAADTLEALFADPARLARMGAAAARHGRRDADVALARLVQQAAAGGHTQ